MAVKKFYQTFAVTGYGYFPFDMLRYDGCFPAEQDSVVSLVHDDFRSNDKKPRLIKLARYVERVNDAPTDGRWRSFGWEVVVGSLNTVRL